MLEFILTCIMVYFIFLVLDWLFRPSMRAPQPPTAEQVHEEIMRVAAKDLGITVEEFKALLQREAAEERKGAKLRIVK